MQNIWSNGRGMLNARVIRQSNVFDFYNSTSSSGRNLVSFTRKQRGHAICLSSSFYHREENDQLASFTTAPLTTLFHSRTKETSTIYGSRFIHSTIPNEAANKKQKKRFANSEESDEQFQEKVRAFAARVGITLDPEVIASAMTHPSFNSENNNDRAEFVGEKILQLTLTDYLFKHYPKAPGSVLSQACLAFSNEKNLLAAGKRLGLQDLIRWRSYEKIEYENKEKSEQVGIIADVVEALIGSIYIKQGGEEAYKFILKYIVPEEALEDLGTYLRMEFPKSTLYSLLVKRGDGAPYYKVLQETGRYSNNSLFVVGVFSDSKQIGEGSGRSIKIAEEVSAQNAIEKEWGKKAYNVPPAELSAYGRLN